MLKLAGVLFVITGCSGVGFYAAMRYLIRIRLLEEIEQAMQFIYSEVEYAACDMIEIMHRLAARGCACQRFWCRMEEALLSCEGRLFYQNWQEHITDMEGYSCLKAEELLLLQELGKNLGNMNREAQLHTIRLFLERLHVIIAQAKGEYREKRKISGIVGITVGIFISVLLV